MKDLDQLCVNAIRMLSIDTVQQANSGHPGMPMGAATMAYVLWTRHLRHNPRNATWPDRDRFVLSAGHASALLYSLLFLTGYDLTMDDLEQFRQWKSRTPGHPERGCTPGVEVTTGPLGQGFGNSVGMAIAERWLAATFNRQGDDVVDHYTYILASDGDLMEGVAAEAASLAGTLRLGRLIVLYDANLITLSATTNLTFAEDVGARFEAYGWHVQRIDGQDTAAVDAALTGLVGGSADLDPSTRTAMAGCGDFESPPTPQSDEGLPTQGAAGGVWGYAGRNVHFGLREHAMAAAMTGTALHGGLLPFGATFFSFSDYMRPSIRLAALSSAHVIYIWTHDSIALGEDGPTHQPVEQLAGLRAMPNMTLIRPSGATETVEAWRVALQHTDGPVGLVLTRQKLPVLDRTVLASASGLAQGAYILAEAASSPLDVILIATGSEVLPALDAHARLAQDGIRSRVVSMPCWELFDAQPQSYRDVVLPPSVGARVSIEAAAPFGWERYVGPSGAIIGVNGFGASAPGPS